MNDYKEKARTFDGFTKNKFGITTNAQDEYTLSDDKIVFSFDEDGGHKVNFNLEEEFHQLEEKLLAEFVAIQKEEHDATDFTNEIKSGLTSGQTRQETIEFTLPPKKCNCGKKTPGESIYCMWCGIKQLAKFCSGCSFNFVKDEKFCPECGTKR